MAVANIEIELLFTAYDKNNDGFLDKAEWRDLCEALEFTADEGARAFKAVDTDNDGRICLQDFATGFAKFSNLHHHHQYHEVDATDAGAVPSRTGISSRKMDESVISSSPAVSLKRYMSANDAVTADHQLSNSRLRKSAIVIKQGNLQIASFSVQSQEELLEFYQLMQTQYPQLQPLFETVVSTIVRDFKNQQAELARLESMYKREKEAHEDHLQQMEEELQQHMRKTEANIRLDEREKIEGEYSAQIVQKHAEIEDLQEHVRKLQTIKSTPEPSLVDDNSVSLLMAQIDQLQAEVRRLKSELRDSQTHTALSKSELATVKQELDDKERDRQRDKAALMDYMREQEKLSQQVYLLQDANRKLHDTNDNIREALEISRQNESQKFGEAQQPTVATIQYYNSRRASVAPNSGVGTPIINELMTDALLQGPAGSSGTPLKTPMRKEERLLPTQESCEVDSLPDEMDSGHDTLRDVNELESELDHHSVSSHGYYGSAGHLPPQHQQQPPQQQDGRLGGGGGEHENERTPVNARYGNGGGARTSTADADAEDASPDVSVSTSTSTSSNRRPSYLALSAKSRGAKADGTAATPRSAASQRKGAAAADSPRNRAAALRGGAGRRSSRAGAQNLTTAPTTKVRPGGQPERMFKVALAGDAAVGKSSFIMRLCQGKFLTNLSTTLGMDFQTKVIEVDGKVVALQLWDTAGQERFRSIAKSYFRRADGVLLLYDCTYERSFLSVCDWVESIKESTDKDVPIMMVANKTDLREQYAAEGRKTISYCEGKRLAQENNALFIESSAKDGEHIMEAVTELARLLRTQEDLEVSTVNVKLTEPKKEKKSPCCSL